MRGGEKSRTIDTFFFSSPPPWLDDLEITKRTHLAGLDIHDDVGLAKWLALFLRSRQGLMKKKKKNSFFGFFVLTKPGFFSFLVFFFFFWFDANQRPLLVRMWRLASSWMVNLLA
jgi:hypothetical protein